MGDLTVGDDGLPVELVGSWAKHKHESLCRYVTICRAARKKWLGPSGGGATYIDVFCGPGRSRVEETGEFIDGGCVAAWKASVECDAPFTSVWIADADIERRGYAAERLRRLGAPVTEIDGDAVTSTRAIAKLVPRAGLNFAFIDPFNLANLDMEIIASLASLRYIDMLVHISAMDLRRNLGLNLSLEHSAIDRFAPGWRDVVDQNKSHAGVRAAVMEYWRSTLQQRFEAKASTTMQLIKSTGGQPLYWLTLVAKHDLAHKFWNVAGNASKQGSFGF